ncbi:MAG TPA: trigger factor [Candidatus Saccharimonadales bacterium]
MQVTKQQVSPTSVTLTVAADAAAMKEVKERVLRDLSKNVRLQGFRAGKAPLSVVEKNIDQQVFQNEFLDRMLNRLYAAAVDEQKLRPVAQPKVSITKFVPFTTLEVTLELQVVGDITLPDYTKFHLVPKKVTVGAKDVDEVLDNLRSRAADTADVTRAAKTGDQVVIDFTGTDAKTGEPISGADGKEYPLVLGSDSFIPGFEAELVGLKAGEHKAFTLTFPEDYGVAALQNRRVTFDTTVQKVQSVAKPKLDDGFAAKVGPFKTLAELKADIQKQVRAEREQQTQRDYESELLENLAKKTKVAIPKVLVDEEIERAEQDERQNLLYRGQTWEEHLKAEGVSESEHREKQRPAAELRVKAGLVLSEVAEQEGITVTPEELEIRMQLLKGQYTDKTMQAEFDKPETRRDIMSRLLSEKTIARLAKYATA